MSERDVEWRASGTVTDGPKVGMASYEPSDPEATFRFIERARPQPVSRPPGFASHARRLLIVWAANLVALLGAGLVLTAVGATDPFQYVAWAAVFGLLNATLPPSIRLLKRPPLVLAAAAGLVVADVLLVWLMTVLARPFHSADLFDFAKAGAVMWAANLPFTVLSLTRGDRAPARRLA